jgi:hypothetical protein
MQMLDLWERGGKSANGELDLLDSHETADTIFESGSQFNTSQSISGE